MDFNSAKRIFTVSYLELSLSALDCGCSELLYIAVCLRCVLHIGLTRALAILSPLLYYIEEVAVVIFCLIAARVGKSI